MLRLPELPWPPERSFIQSLPPPGQLLLVSCPMHALLVVLFVQKQVGFLPGMLLGTDCVPDLGALLLLWIRWGTP